MDKFNEKKGVKRGKKKNIKSTKKVRKHQGIYQIGPKKGQLKLGYKYSGKKTKSGLKIIIKVNNYKNKHKSKNKHKCKKGGDGKWYNYLEKNIPREWKSNNVVDQCMTSTCMKPFGLLTRKHHCRYCGGIFCADCSKHAARLWSYFERDGKPHDVRTSGEYKHSGIPGVGEEWIEGERALSKEMYKVCDRCFYASKNRNQQSVMPKTSYNRVFKPAEVQCCICKTDLGGLTRKHHCHKCKKYTCDSSDCYFTKPGRDYQGLKFCKTCWDDGVKTDIH